MRLRVERRWAKEKYIIGRLFVDDVFFCHTLEPPRTGEHPCIPQGHYKVEMYPSGKFHALRPILLNVPGRSGILIHEGNFPRDTMGCILVGKNERVGSLNYSRNTLSNLMRRIQQSKDDVYIDVIDF